MARNAYTLIKDALEEYYCRHPEFFIGPGGAEMCPPLDDALDALERIASVMDEAHGVIREMAPGMTVLISQIESISKPD